MTVCWQVYATHGIDVVIVQAVITGRLKQEQLRAKGHLIYRSHMCIGAENVAQKRQVPCCVSDRLTELVESIDHC